MILCTWVSTQIAGFLNATATTRFAVFLPTPGSFVSSSTVFGMILLNFSFNIFGICFRYFVKR